MIDKQVIDIKQELHKLCNNDKILCCLDAIREIMSDEYVHDNKEIELFVKEEILNMSNEMLLSVHLTAIIEQRKS